MRDTWVRLLVPIVDELPNIPQLECPECGRQTIKYQYVIHDKADDRKGYIHLWCSDCMRGILVTTTVPVNADALYESQERELQEKVPNYRIVM